MLVTGKGVYQNTTCEIYGQTEICEENFSEGHRGIHTLLPRTATAKVPARCARESAHKNYQRFRLPPKSRCRPPPPPDPPPKLRSERSRRSAGRASLITRARPISCRPLQICTACAAALS